MRPPYIYEWSRGMPNAGTRAGETRDMGSLSSGPHGSLSGHVLGDWPPTIAPGAPERNVYDERPVNGKIVAAQLGDWFPTNLTTTQKVLLVGGALAAVWFFFLRKKLRRNPRRRSGKRSGKYVVKWQGREYHYPPARMRSVRKHAREAAEVEARHGGSEERSWYQAVKRAKRA